MLVWFGRPNQNRNRNIIGQMGINATKKYKTGWRERVGGAGVVREGLFEQRSE